MNAQEHPLYQVFLKVLEDWAMMLVDPTEDGTAIFDLDEPLFMSLVNMHGAFHGTISIVAQEGFMRALAGNLLGGESTQSSQEELRDAFKEMGNVLAGNFITVAYGDDVAFDVLNPRVVQISPDEYKAICAAPYRYSFLADDIPVCVTFSLDEGTEHDR